MNTQTPIPSTERRKKPRAPLETPPPEQPQPTLNLGWLLLAVVIGLGGLIAIFWMGAMDKL